MTTSIEKEILDIIIDSPIYREAIERKEKEKQAAREKAFKDIEALDTIGNKDLLELEKVKGAAFDKLTKAKAAFEKARDEYLMEEKRKSGRSHKIERVRSKLQQIILETADPAIDRFIEKWERVWERERFAPTAVTTWHGENWKTDAHETYMRFNTNRPRQLAIMNALKEAAQLKTQYGIDVAVELKKLEETIPKPSSDYIEIKRTTPKEEPAYTRYGD